MHLHSWRVSSRRTNVPSSTDLLPHCESLEGPSGFIAENCLSFLDILRVALGIYEQAVIYRTMINLGYVSTVDRMVDWGALPQEFYGPRCGILSNSNSG